MTDNIEIKIIITKEDLIYGLTDYMDREKATKKADELLADSYFRDRVISYLSCDDQYPDQLDSLIWDYLEDHDNL